MSVLIVGPTNFYQMPYLCHYTDIFEKSGVIYDIFYWNRFSIDEDYSFRPRALYSFDYKMLDEENSFKKIRGYRRFRSKLLEHVKRESYSKIIVLTTVPALLISSYLRSSYAQRYIVDIRDYSFENLWFYRLMEKRLFDKAHSVIISSKGFKEFLPDSNNLIVTNNCSDFKDEIRSKFRTKFINNNSDVIRILYIGSISYYTENIRFLESFGNAVGFNLIYVGFGPALEGIKSYCNKMDLRNVSFHGRYAPSEKIDFYYKADIVYNMYGNNSLVTRYALSNKLYDACGYYVPILVNVGTLMTDESVNNGFGISLDLNEDDCPEYLRNWYATLDKQRFIEDCDAYLKHANKEKQNFGNRIEAFIS